MERGFVFEEMSLVFARVVKLVDTQDLKSCGQKWLCGYRSRPGYMFFVYILQSQSTGRYYIGYSELPERRLSEHNSGKVKSTRPYRPWVKVYIEQFATESEAMNREKEIKSKKSRVYLERLIEQTN